MDSEFFQRHDNYTIAQTLENASTRMRTKFSDVPGNVYRWGRNLLSNKLSDAAKRLRGTQDCREDFIIDYLYRSCDYDTIGRLLNLKKEAMGTVIRILDKLYASPSPLRV